MIALVAVQGALKDVVRTSALRADSAHALIDLAIANPTFTVRRVESELSLSYGRANKLVGQLVELVSSAWSTRAATRGASTPRAYPTS